MTNIRIDYTNWRGERRIRSIRPISVTYGATPHHSQPQWLLRALDMEKGEERDFAMLRIHRMLP